MNERMFRARRAFKRHGLRGVALKIAEVMRDAIVAPNYILYCADLQVKPDAAPELRDALSVECIQRQSDLSPDDREQIVSHRYAEIESETIRNRFARGAWLWILRQQTTVLGFVWTIERQPIETYFFPLGRGDVHVFDNEIFFEHRGRGHNPILINTVLACLRKSGLTRAFVETRERNTAERKSLAKTAFRQIGRARKRRSRQRTVVTWT